MLEVRKKTSEKKPKRRIAIETLADGWDKPKRKAVTKKRVAIATRKPATPLVVIKKEPTEEEMTAWLSTIPGFIEGLTETEYSATRLYGYQVKYLNRTSMFWHVDKARQTGFSYIFAGQALAKAHLMNKYTGIFISINQEEANEKVTYARAMYDSMPLSWQKKLVVDNKRCLEYEGTWRGRTTRTRIISHAQREPRGKGGNTEVILDEAAHYIFGEQIYVAAVPIITRGKGCMTVGSTPLGKSGIHWDIYDNPEFRKIYNYQQVMWWDCRAFVKQGMFKEAKKYAPDLTTHERVDKYGNDKVKAIFIGMDLESFQQEYECHHIDETVAYFPLSLIKRCSFSTVTDPLFLADDENAEDVKQYPIAERYPKVKFGHWETLDDILDAKHQGIIKGRLYAGFDVGRRQHSAELMILEDVPDGPLATRGRIHFHNTDFEAMEAELERSVDGLDLEKLRIDETGPGIELAENMVKRYPGICEAVNFTNQWKEESASHTRRLMESQNIALPDDRSIRNQIHSIKRIVTEHGNLRFDAEKNKEHHGDVLWGIAMAVMELRQTEVGTLASAGSTNSDEVPQRTVRRIPKRIFVPNAPMVRQAPIAPGFGVQIDPREEVR